MDLSTRAGRREQGRRIQVAVERAGLSIEELAGRVGCSRALIYQYLSGSTLAQPDRLQRIAASCGVPLTHFFDENLTDGVEVQPAAAGPAESDGANRNSTVSLLELAAAQEAPADYAALARTCEQILALPATASDTALLAKTCLRIGNAYLRTSDYSHAADFLRRAISSAAGDPALSALEADARQSYGHVLISLGSLDDARDQFLAASRGPGAASQWKGTLSLGSVHTMLGEYREAMARFDEAATIIEGAQEDGRLSARDAAIGLIYVDGNRTNVYLNGGDFNGARPLIQRSLISAEAYGIADEHLEARFDLAWCDYHTGNWASAISALRANVQLARFVGDRSRETLSQAWLGMVYAAAGDCEAALVAGKEALTLAQSRSDRRGEMYAQLAMADAYLGLPHHENEARYHANLALAVAVSMQSERAEAECRLRLARYGAQTDRISDLIEQSERALKLADKLGARHLEALALCWKSVAAPEAAEKALAISVEIGLTEGIWRANRSLAAASNSVSAAADACRILDALREQLLAAGLTDTLLEDRYCLDSYRLYIQGLINSGDSDTARKALDASNWPPLEALFGTLLS